jgi:ubiquinone biosynthesis protein COQ4
MVARQSSEASPAQQSAWRVSGPLARVSVAVKSFFLMIICERQRIRQGMRFLFATEGQAFERTLSAFRAHPAGRELLQRRPNLPALYADRAVLEACPPGSLGQWYAQFMTEFDLSEETYLTIAIEQAAPFADHPERAWFHLRFDSSHDIRHILAGYGPDLLGEICLLCFRFGQIRHPGIVTLILLGFINLTFARRGPVLAPLWEAYCRGRRARLLDLLPWEDGFAEPLAVHRAALGLTPPQSYPHAFAAEAYLELPAEDGVQRQSGATQRVFEAT